MPTTPSRSVRPRPRKRAGAFTLLELLLAIAILAGMALLVGSLWGQVAAWGDDNAAHHRIMRLQRVLGLIRDQWATRTSSLALDDLGGAVLMTPDRIAFPTTTPILHQGWPLVVAEYRIERDLGSGPSVFGLWKLTYEESRLTDPAAAPDEDDAGAGGTPMRREMTLLAGMPHLAFERFGERKVAGADAARAARRSAPGQDGAAPDAADQPPGAADPARDIFGDAADDDDDASPDEDDDDATPRWREFKPGDLGVIPAVRLTGEYEGRGFTCLFVTGALR